MCELGWKSVGVLELTALPSIAKDYWVPMVRETDVLLVNGGDPLYLCYWMVPMFVAPGIIKSVHTRGVAYALGRGDAEAMYRGASS